ncbi:MAG: Blue-light-activated protein, partial [Armatimonadetes bacterium]|nr:Blue-light-activated protein [Armatimonadota bacterium]
MATILIIDDRAPNREYLVTLLGYGGHRLLQASDGAEGLTIVRAEQPDLVIADILMPTMDGFEFVRRLRADPAIAGTRVMFFTAHYHEREARSLAAECGVAHVLIKPAEPEVVLRTVEEALGETQTPAAPPAEEFEHDHLRLLTDTLARKADALSAANHQLNALIELGLQLGSERDPARLLQTYCVSAREILGARYALVGILDAEGRELLRFFTSGFEPAVWERLGTPDPTIGALRVILEDRRTLRLTRPADTGEDLQLPESFPAFASFLGAPISSPARVYGWICLFDKVGAPGFSEEDERLAAILAAQVGRIYENGSLYANLLSHSAQMEEEIRERRRVEADLRESEGRFRTLCEAAPISIYQSDAEGLVVYTNARWQALSGLTFEESLGVGWNRADHPEDRDRVLREWLEAVRLGREFRTVCRILPPSGELRWVNGRAAPILAADGR